MHYSLHSKNTIIRPSPMITKSPRRSPHCRINSTSGNPSKTRGIRNNTNYTPYCSPNKSHSLPIHYTLIMRNNYNQLNLHTSNGFKIPYRLLICKSHGAGNCSYYNSDTMKLYRSYCSYNRPRSYFISIILSSKLKLRTSA